jgi:type IV secretory pathway VirB10-like protein
MSQDDSEEFPDSDLRDDLQDGNPEDDKENFEVYLESFDDVLSDTDLSKDNKIDSEDSNNITNDDHNIQSNTDAITSDSDAHDDISDDDVHFDKTNVSDNEDNGEGKSLNQSNEGDDIDLVLDSKNPEPDEDTISKFHEEELQIKDEYYSNVEHILSHYHDESKPSPGNPDVEINEPENLDLNIIGLIKSNPKYSLPLFVLLFGTFLYLVISNDSVPESKFEGEAPSNISQDSEKFMDDPDSTFYDPYASEYRSFDENQNEEAPSEDDIQRVSEPIQYPPPRNRVKLEPVQNTNKKKSLDEIAYEEALSSDILVISDDDLGSPSMESNERPGTPNIQEIPPSYNDPYGNNITNDFQQTSTGNNYSSPSNNFRNHSNGNGSSLPSSNYGNYQSQQSPTGNYNEPSIKTDHYYSDANYGQFGEQINSSFQDPISDLMLFEGTYIPATLISGISSDLPGDITAMINRDIFDSIHQQFLLIPKGSRLIGSYSSQIYLYQNRVVVTWSRLILPDGRSLLLPKMNSVDLEGYSGLRGQVDNHYWDIIKSSLALSLIGAGTSSLYEEQSTFGNSPQEILIRQLTADLSRISNDNLNRQMARPPTISIRNGIKFNVFLSGDLAFDEPYMSQINSYNPYE